MSLLRTIVLKRTVSTASLRVQRDISTNFQNVDIYKKSPATKQEVVSKVAQFAAAAGIEAEGADAVEIPYVVHYVMTSQSIDLGNSGEDTTQVALLTTGSASQALSGTRPATSSTFIVPRTAHSGIGFISQGT